MGKVGKTLDVKKMKRMCERKWLPMHTPGFTFSEQKPM